MGFEETKIQECLAKEIQLRQHKLNPLDLAKPNVAAVNLCPDMTQTPNIEDRPISPPFVHYKEAQSDEFPHGKEEVQVVQRQPQDELINELRKRIEEVEGRCTQEGALPQILDHYVNAKPVTKEDLDSLLPYREVFAKIPALEVAMDKFSELTSRMYLEM